MRILDFLFGCRRIEIPAEDRSAVFRLLQKYGMSEKSQRNTGDTVSFIVDRRTCRTLLPAMREEGISYTAGEIRGIPHFLRFLRERIGLVFGLTLALVLLLFCKSRIWEIRIEGDGSIDEDSIRMLLSEAGLRDGMAIRDLRAEAVTFACRTKDSRIAWMNIHMDGVRAVVEWMPVFEGSAPAPDRTGTGANLVAVADAYITDLRLQTGTPEVKAGQIVRAGDLLVSGIRDGNVSYAAGEVIGKVKRTITVSVPLEQSGVREVRRNTDTLALTFFDKTVRIFDRKNDETVSESRRIWIGRTIRLPLSIETKYFCTYETYTYQYTEAEAVEVAMKRLRAEINGYLAEGELLSQSISGAFDDGVYTATAEVYYLMNIAKTLEFSAQSD